RGSFAHPKLYRASFRDTRNGSAPDVLLEAGDGVFVPDHWYATATEVLARLAPLIGAASVARGFFYYYPQYVAQ
ncbi:MAG: hypothetical protein JST92_15110, partial [Deltaproteobacteria bacterium]|nr:hypothetical protein [Deltaproteobacteria bacterium]